MSRPTKPRSDRWHVLLCSLVIAACPGCSIETFLNQIASFGPDGALAGAGAPIGSGGRAAIQVIIENNTPFRAVFTYGVFDNTDEVSTPVFLQFSPDSQLVAPNSSATLEANSNSGVVVLPCARVFSVGSRSLLNLIENNSGALAPLIDEAGLIDGVGFAGEGVNTDFAADPNEGFASGFEAFLGVDFNCGSLLLVSLEFNEIGDDRFRVDMQVLPARRGDQSNP